MPFVLALNMADEARSRGFHVDEDRLRATLGVDVVQERVPLAGFLEGLRSGAITEAGGFVRDAFAGNVIPSGRINPIAANVAKLIPLGSLKERMGELEKYRDQPMVVVCRSGNRSGSACALLSKQGFTQVHNLGGGMMGWQGSNLPVSK